MSWRSAAGLVAAAVPARSSDSAARRPAANGGGVAVFAAAIAPTIRKTDAKLWLHYRGGVAVPYCAATRWRLA